MFSTHIPLHLVKPQPEKQLKTQMDIKVIVMIAAA